MSKFLICLFGGWFGLHKFIEGKTWQGVLYLCTFGLCFFGWGADCIVYLVKWLNESKSAPEPVASAPVQTPVVVSAPDPEPVSPEQYERMAEMCKDIHKEYKDLLKDYSGSDTEGKVYILKECYRKLDVIETTVSKYKCYYDIDVYDEYEKIEKKARSFINAYIKSEREAGNDDYMIDVIQFADDLDFISDYIYEKDDKLNRDA